MNTQSKALSEIVNPSLIKHELNMSSDNTGARIYDIGAYEDYPGYTLSIRYGPHNYSDETSVEIAIFDTYDEFAILTDAVAGWIPMTKIPDIIDYMTSQQWDVVRTITDNPLEFHKEDNS